jgi:hypothetical protein
MLLERGVQQEKPAQTAVQVTLRPRHRLTAIRAASIHGRKIIEVETGIIPTSGVGSEPPAVAVHKSATYRLMQRAAILTSSCISLNRISMMHPRLCFRGAYSDLKRRKHRDGRRRGGKYFPYSHEISLWRSLFWLMPSKLGRKAGLQGLRRYRTLLNLHPSLGQR